jgi:hypothetical protein
MMGNIPRQPQLARAGGRRKALVVWVFQRGETGTFRLFGYIKENYDAIFSTV